MTEYGTVAGFRAYHTARGRSTASYGEAEVDAAKLIASEWIDTAFFNPLPCGVYRVGQRAQVRAFPVTGWTDAAGYSVGSASVPTEVENATYEATLRELQGAGALTKDYTASKYKRVRVEGAVDVEYASMSASDAQTQFPIIGQILAPLFRTAGMSALSSVVVRA